LTAPTNGLPLVVPPPVAGQPLTYAWDWGDGGRGVSAVHTYTLAGNYQAVLTVSDSLGLTATAQIAISAGNHAPVATLLTPLTGTLVPADTSSRSGAATDVE
jgi:PKD repeat protein